MRIKATPNVHPAIYQSLLKPNITYVKSLLLKSIHGNNEKPLQTTFKVTSITLGSTLLFIQFYAHMTLTRYTQHFSKFTHHNTNVR